MDGHPATRIFNQEKINELFPKERANQFFEALFGDHAEGAYDIALKFIKHTGNSLQFEFHLTQRPGQCLACNLTAGLPSVFSRHPVINVKGLVGQIGPVAGRPDAMYRLAPWRHSRDVQGTSRYSSHYFAWIRFFHTEQLLSNRTPFLIHIGCQANS